MLAPGSASLSWAHSVDMRRTAVKSAVWRPARPLVGKVCRRGRLTKTIAPGVDWGSAPSYGPPMAHRFSTLAIVTAVAAASTVSSGQNRTNADHYVPSRPETVTWGWIPIDKAPVVTIKSGQTVRMDTLSHHGTTQAQDPDTFLAEYGIARQEILQDVRDFWASRAGRPREGRGGAHILTGPVAVVGAEPGDMLEVRSHRAERTRAIRRQHDRADERRARRRLSGNTPWRCPVRHSCRNTPRAANGLGEWPAGRAVLRVDPHSVRAVHGHHGRGASKSGRG